MATGSIISCVIQPDGWRATVRIQGFTTGAGYHFGLTADRVPTAGTPYLTVTSLGFDDEGAPITVERRVYLTIQNRKAYPDDAQNWESTSGGDLYFDVSLSEYVFAKDKNGGAGTSGVDPVLTAPAGWITSGANSSLASSSLTCSNTSEIGYQVPIANWTMPGRERLAGYSVSLRAVGYHWSGRGGVPLACMKFVATDGTHTASTVVAAPELTSGEGDAMPLVEYSGDVNLTGFTDDSEITCNLVAYPVIGDAPFDSTEGSDTADYNPYTSPQSWYLDVAGAQIYPIAVVNISTGTSGGAVLGSDTSGNRGFASASPFQTIAQASAAISAYLAANEGRTDISGATIYLAGGNHSTAGGTTADSVPMSSGHCWLTIKPFPGVTTAVLVPHANKKIRAKYIKFDGCKFSRSADGSFFDANGASVLLKNCTVVDTRGSASSTSIIDNTDNVWLVRSTFNRVQTPTAFIRGCSFPEGDQLGRRKLIVGSKWIRFGTPSNIFLASAGTSTSWMGGIGAFNAFFKCHKSVFLYPGVGTGEFVQGCAVIQNLLECDGVAGGERLVRCAADGNMNKTWHVLIWHNTITGEKMNLGYNDEPVTAPHWHHCWSVCMNSTWSFGNKGDTFCDDTEAIGNWVLHNGVMCHGNVIGGGEFSVHFRGLHSKAGFGDPGDEDYLYHGYVADRSQNGTGAGMGDYHPTTVAAIKSIDGPVICAWDLDGNERASVDAAGVFRYTVSADPPNPVTMLRLTPDLWIFQEDFEAGALPTGWTTDASGYSFSYTPALQGSKSLSVSGSSTGTLRGVYTPTIDFPDHGNVWSLYMQIKLVVIASGGTGRFMEIRRASDNALQNILRVNVSGQLSLANGSDAGSTGNFTLTTGTLYHLWIQRNADGTLSAWIAATATHPGGAAMMTATASNTGKAGNLHIGGARNMQMAVDAIRIQPGTIGSNPVT